MKPSHIARDGSVAMVDVSDKHPSSRYALAEALVRMSPAAQAALRSATLPKGDALVTAQVAGILAAKQTAGLIPLAHPLPLSSVDVRFNWRGDGVLRVEAEARTTARTGVEMEAMVAVCIAALTIYDMSKALDKTSRLKALGFFARAAAKAARSSFDKRRMTRATNDL